MWLTCQRPSFKTAAACARQCWPATMLIAWFPRRFCAGPRRQAYLTRRTVVQVTRRWWCPPLMTAAACARLVLQTTMLFARRVSAVEDGSGTCRLVSFLAQRSSRTSTGQNARRRVRHGNGGLGYRVPLVQRTSHCESAHAQENKLGKGTMKTIALLDAKWLPESAPKNEVLKLRFASIEVALSFQYVP